MSPAFDATFTIAPPPSSMCGRAAWHMRNVPVRLTPRIAAPALVGLVDGVREAADPGGVHEHLGAAEVGGDGRPPCSSPRRDP